MHGTFVDGYRRVRRLGVSLGLAALVASTATSAGLAADGTFDGGGKIGGSYDDQEYVAGPQTVTYEDTLYLYGTADDGNGYYATYDGKKWSDYTGWKDQPAKFAYEPAAAVNAVSRVFFAGDDGHLYGNAYDSGEWTGWEDLAGDYTFEVAPYANIYDDHVYLHGVATDGYLYTKYYDGAEWTVWAPVSDDYTPGAYQPYAVDWDGYQNVFWTATDGQVYWNRYDGSEWSGAKALTGDGDFGTAPYAIGYSPEKTLYAYANGKDGAPYWNTFKDGDGWSGWEAYAAPVPVEVKWQPHAYEYDDVQHLILTGDDGHGYYTTYDGEYGEWTDLGANYTYDPYTYEYADGYYLAYTGEDGAIYTKEYAAGDGKDDGY